MEYLSLILGNPVPLNPKAVDFDLMMHEGGACVNEDDEWSEEPLPER